MSNKHYMNDYPISIYNLYKYMVNLYKLGVIPEFNVHFNNDLTEIIFLTEYDNNKWKHQGTSIITYNINTKKWKGCINTHTINQLCSKYPYLLEKNLFIDNTIINEEYLTMESYDIDDILEPSLNPFEIEYLNISCNYDLRNLHSIDNKEINNMYFSCYHAFINNIIRKEFDINNNTDYGEVWKYYYTSANSYLTYSNFLNEYIC